MVWPRKELLCCISSLNIIPPTHLAQLFHSAFHFNETTEKWVTADGWVVLWSVRPSVFVLALMMSWSWICNVCWCGVHGGDFHLSTACHKHISKSVDIKINQAQAEEQEDNNRDLNIPVWMDICIPMLLNTRTNKRTNKHTQIWTTYR